MDYRLALITGVDIPIPECGLILHQPTIKEISLIGETDFFIGAQCLCINKSMYEGQGVEEISNFSLFSMLITDERTKDKKQSVMSVLTLLFPKYQIFFTPRSILFKLADETFMIDEGNFEKLQEVLRKIFCLQQSAQDTYNPVNDKAKKIADKIMAGRKKVAEQKAMGASSIFTQYLSVLSVGLSLSITETINFTQYQLYDLIERYVLYKNWDLDMKARLAGAKGETKPEDWMKNIH